MPVGTKKVLYNSKSLVGLRCLPSQQIITNCTRTRCGWLDSHGANCLGNTANSSHSQQLWGSENSDQCDQVKMKSIQCNKFKIKEHSLVESWEGECLKRETRDPGLEWKSGRLLFSRKEDRMERERSWIGMACMCTWQRGACHWSQLHDARLSRCRAVFVGQCWHTCVCVLGVLVVLRKCTGGSFSRDAVSLREQLWAKLRQVASTWEHFQVY